MIEDGHKKEQSGVVLVVCETQEGELHPVSLALCGEACEFARQFSPAPDVLAVLPGDAADAGPALGSCGVQTVFHFSPPATEFAPDVISETIAKCSRNSGAEWIFFAHTVIGADVAPRTAARLKAGMVSRCVELKRQDDNNFSALQPAYDGRLYRRLRLAPEGVNVISWEPNALGSYSTGETHRAGVVPIEPESSKLRGVDPVRTIVGDPGAVALEEADRVVAMGRGMAPDGLAYIQEAAEALGAAVGATRPVIDLQLLPFEKQIGQTGVTVAPRLMVTCGVSGANEFTVGITGSQLIIALNNDPQARIFQFADLGLVGDAYETLQELMILLKQHKPKPETSNGQNT